MSTVRLALRATDPQRTVPLIEAAAAARAAAIKAIEAYTKALFAPVLETGEEMTATATFGFDGSIYPSGFQAEVGITSRIAARTGLPEGLRYDAKNRLIVPAKKTPAGRQIAAGLSALDFTYPIIDGLGGIVFGYRSATPPPAAESHLETCYSSGWSFHVIPDPSTGSTTTAPQAYATLSLGRLDTRGARGDLAALIGTAWEQIRPSTFMAAQEEHDERLAAAAS